MALLLLSIALIVAGAIGLSRQHHRTQSQFVKIGGGAVLLAGVLLFIVTV